MKVAILHRYFWPESISVLPLIYGDIAQLHSERGDDVTVHTGADRDYSADYVARFGDRIRVTAFRSAQDRELAIHKRILNALRLLLIALRVLTQRDKPEVLYIATYPPFLGPMVVLMGRLFARETRFIFYAQDLLLYRMPGRLLKWMYRKTLTFTIRHSALCITISESMRDEVLSYFLPGETPDMARKIAVMRNYSVDLEDPAEAEQHIEKAVDIIYAGNHGEAQNLSAFLEALGHLGGAQPRVAFYGSGTEKDGLRAQADRLGLNIQFHDPVSRDAVRQRIKEARFGLVGAKPDLMKYAFPSKLATYNSVGVRGMVMSDPDEREAIWIRDNGLGFAINPHSPQAMSVDIAAALAQPDGTTSHDLIATAHKVFSKESYLAEVEKLLDRISAGAPKG